MDQEVNLSIKLGELSLSSDISATFVVIGPDQTVEGVKKFQDGIDIGSEVSSLGNGCLAVGNELCVGSYNFFYKGIELNVAALSAKIYLTAEQPRYPFPMIRINNSWTTFRIDKQDLNILNLDTYAKLSGNSLTDTQTHKQLSSIWLNLSHDDPRWVARPHRQDYNQLYVDLGPDYQSNLTAVQQKLSDYFAFSRVGETSLSVYNLSTMIGQQITMVNNDKINYLRCGNITGVENGCILNVNLSSFCVNHLSTNGIQFNDFDYDDASLVFIDSPTKPGPANTSTYSSLNVGAENIVLRRCSAGIGKQNRTESDFCIAIGRKAEARHYCSFVWGPAAKAVSPSGYTFTIGQRDKLSTCKTNKAMRTLYVCGTDGGSEELHSFLWGCISSDNNLLSTLFVSKKDQIKSWLGIS